MSALFSCDEGLYYFDCGGDDQGCCSVNDACLQQNGCPDVAKCNDDLGETPCGVLCCPDDAQCAYSGYACEGFINGAVVTVIPSPPSSTSTVTSTRTLISTILNSDISTTTETSASTTDSTSDISIEGAASIASPSSLATKVTSLLTSITTSSPGNAALGSPSSSSSSSSSRSHGAAIGGSVGAVVGLIMAACLLSWLIVWRRRKTSGDKRKIEGSDEPQLQGTVDNGGRGALDSQNGTNEKTAKSTRSSILMMLSPNRRRRAKHSSKSEPSPVYAEMAEPNGNVSNPELSSDPPADQIAELPAEVERPAVQAPGRASESSWTDINSNAGTVEMAGESPMSPMSLVSPMSPNLDVGGARRGRSVNRDGHVLSFMNYNDKMPSPVR